MKEYRRTRFYQQYEQELHNGAVVKADVDSWYQDFVKDHMNRLSNWLFSQADKKPNANFKTQVKSFLMGFSPEEQKTLLEGAILRLENDLSPLKRMFNKGRLDLIGQLFELDGCENCYKRACFMMIQLQGQKVDYTEQVKNLLEKGVQASATLSNSSPSLFLQAFEEAACCSDEIDFALKMKMLSLLSDKKYQPDINLRYSNGDNLLIRYVSGHKIIEKDGHIAPIMNPKLVSFLLDAGIDARDKNRAGQTALDVLNALKIGVKDMPAHQTVRGLLEQKLGDITPPVSVSTHQTFFEYALDNSLEKQ